MEVITVLKQIVCKLDEDDVELIKDSLMEYRSGLYKDKCFEDVDRLDNIIKHLDLIKK